jgi:hypothetical protein
VDQPVAEIVPDTQPAQPQPHLGLIDSTQVPGKT